MLVLITIISGYVGFIYLKGGEIFRNRKIYYVRLERAEGLEQAAKVIVSGFPVGQVVDIKLQFDTIEYQDSISGKYVLQLNPWVMATISIRKDLFIPEGTKVRLVSTSILGERALELILGNSKKEIPEGTLLHGEIALTVEEMVRQEILPVKLKAEQLLGQIDTLVQAVRFFVTGVNRERLSRGIRSLAQALRNIVLITETLKVEISENRSTIKAALSSLKKTTDTAAMASGQFLRLVNNMADISDSLKLIQFSQTIKQLKSTLVRLDTVLKLMAEGEGTIGLLLTRDSAYWYLEQALANLDTLIDDLHQRPYRYVHVSLIGPSPKKIEKWERKLRKKQEREKRKQQKKQAK